jgi:hypothetical protein
MKVLKQSKQKIYVWRNMHLNLSRIIIFLLLFISCIALFAIGGYLFATVGLILIPLIYLLGIVAYRKYAAWFRGDEGENAVIGALKPLPDSYHMINSVVPTGSRGDVDHIIIGPNGIFVVETKNYSGKISCIGDDWKRQKTGKGGTDYDIEIGSPSNQVKRNSKILKDLLIRHKREIFKRYSPHIWVHAIVVFTNPSCELKVRNKTVEVMKLGELYGFIKDKSSEDIFSVGELERMKSVILREWK